MTVINAANVPNQRVIYTCKKCKKTHARDYMRQDGNLRLFRMEDSQVVWQEQDTHCTCISGMYRTRLNMKFVYGTYSSAHKCDPRCLNAKGKDCTCECGGLNHGRSFLI